MKRNFARGRTCTKCNGHGTIVLTDNSLRVCPTCKGRGTVE